MTNLINNPSASGSAPGPSASSAPAVSGINTTNAPPASPVALSVDNPRSYPAFDLRLFPTYTHRQLRYYHISGAMLNVDKEELRRQMNDRKEVLELVSWDGNTRANTPESDTRHTSLISPSPPPPPHSASRTLSLDADSEANSECSVALPGYKGHEV